MVEQSGLKLDAQYAPYRFIEDACRHFARPNQTGKLLEIRTVNHVHVHACGDGFGCCLGIVGCSAVCNHLVRSTPVADHKTVELPFIATNVSERVMIVRGRNSVQILYSYHERTCASIYGR